MSFLCPCKQRVSSDESKEHHKEEDGRVIPERPPGCIGCLQRRLYILPIITMIWMISSIFLTYIISTALGHTDPGFPYISHTAIEDPERGVFSTCLAIGAILLGANAAIRYLFMKQIFLNLKFCRPWYKANLASLNLAFISAFGLILLSSFPTNVQKVMHYFGAFLVFGGGLAYCWIQTRFSWKLWSCGNMIKRNIVIAQLVISLLLTLSLLMFTVSKTIYKAYEASGRDTQQGAMRSVYLLSTTTEWIASILNSIFVLTFIPDFRKVKLRSCSVEGPCDTKTDIPSSQQSKESGKSLDV